MTIKEGYFKDDGTEVDPATIPIPPLCISCLKNNDATEEVPCMITRMDQMQDVKNGKMFLCFAYEPNNPSINKKKALQEMENYWNEQNRNYVQKKRKKG
jgi:hypothetical protein